MLIEARQLSVHYGHRKGHIIRAVDKVDLAIARSAIVGLIGESGSGKSSLGRALLGLETRSAGSVRLAGEQLPQRFRSRDHRRYARSMQMVFQNPFAAFNPRLTIADSLSEALTLLRRPAGGAARRQLLEVWMERVGLSVQLLDRYPYELSGGQCQRASIARALIGEPSFVVCDEAIAALDVSIQAQIVELLKSLRDSLDMSLLFIGHDLAMVHYLCDEIAVMQEGKIVEQGAADSVYFNPRHPYTQALIEAQPAPLHVATATDAQ